MKERERDRALEAVELLYEDEELALCCQEVLPVLEEFFVTLNRVLPPQCDEDFFVELANSIRVNLLENPDYKKRFLEGRMGVITVTYELGSMGLEVARRVAQELGYKLIYTEILSEVAKRLGVPEWKIEDYSEFKYVPSKLSFFDLFQLDKSLIDFGALFGEKKKEISFEEFRDALVKTITAFAVSNNAVIVGHGAACVLQEYPNSLHVKVEAPFHDRLKVFAENTGLSIEEAEKQLRKIDSKEVEFYKDLCNEDVRRINLFHLKVNTSKLSVDNSKELVINAFKMVAQ